MDQSKTGTVRLLDVDCTLDALMRNYPTRVHFQAFLSFWIGKQVLRASQQWVHSLFQQMPESRALLVQHCRNKGNLNDLT
jgi:hypothetical protein